MKKYKQLISIILIALVAVIITGCGGSDHHTLDSRSSAAFTIKWPERTRLIPLACESITIEARKGDTLVAGKTIDRPTGGDTSTVTLEQLPVGEITFTATAYPQAGGQGVAQATGAVTETGQANQRLQITLTMASTIATVAITPASPTVTVNGTRQLTATAKNAAGEVVMVPVTNAFTWKSLTTAKATVDANGKVTGVAEGTATITATEKESGKSATITVTVEVAPQWQEKIVFATQRSAWDIYIMNADGSGIQQLTHDGNEIQELEPSLSPDGTTILFSEGYETIWIMDIYGKNQHKLTDGEAPDWSPDGTKIAYVADGIYVMGADGSNPTRLTTGYAPTWSPDGENIAFTDYVNGAENIYRMKSDGSERTQITAFTGDPYAGEIDWSPDGNKLAFIHGLNNPYTPCDVYTIHVDGTDLRQLTSNPNDDEFPCWSPDGTRFVYTAEDSDGLGEFWVMNADGTGKQRLLRMETYYLAYPDWGHIGPTWTGDLTVE